MKVPQPNTIIWNDNLKVMKSWPKNCIDSIVTDPPYGLEFMGKEWDSFKKGNIITNPQGAYEHKKGFKKMVRMLNDRTTLLIYQEWCQVWAKECLRIAKPGAIMLCFGGTRTFHRVTCAIEDAGWEIRDCLMWLYGSGFPKSLDISKAIDKKAGAKRTKFIEKNVAYPDSDCWGIPNKNSSGENPNPTSYKVPTEKNGGNFGGVRKVSLPATSLAQLWSGYGTALKPAWEPIIVAMKPKEGSFADNAEKYGVAGLNIDGGRIGTEQIESGRSGRKVNTGFCTPKAGGKKQYSQGRWPANLILDEESAKLLDEQSGISKSTNRPRNNKVPTGEKGIYGHFEPVVTFGHSDSGGVSRFFYIAKASRGERNAGLSGTKARQVDEGRHPDKPGGNNPRNRGAREDTNYHPTVKPLSLMQYLCMLLKMPNKDQIILDPFMGSGTTCIACKGFGINYIGIEKELKYYKIAKRRLKAVRPTLFEKPVKKMKKSKKRESFGL